MKLIVPPPAQGLICAVAMYFVEQSLGPSTTTISGQRGIALTLGGAGLLIDLLAIAAFINQRTTISPFHPSQTKKLVISGLYRFSRNPMYLGLLLILLGWGLWLGHPLNIALIALWIGYITHFQIKPEEAVLREKFGGEYDTYRQQVRRWI